MLATIYKLDRADCQALKIRDAYSIHRAVYSLFPQGEASRDFLYVDKGGDVRGRTILVLSARPPQPPAMGLVECKDVPEAFLLHDVYGFEVVLNPVRRDPKSGKLLPVIGREALAEWFLGKAPEWGFSAASESLDIRSPGVVRYEKNGATCTHNTATFTGRLQVVDREAFMSSFRHGLGRAKSFGFGLLQLVPLKN